MINFNYKWKKCIVIVMSVFVTLYALFLLIPIALSPLLNSYTEKVETQIKNITGIDANIEKVGVFTTPNFRLGLKFEKISLNIPTETSPFFECDNAKADIKLLPLVFKKIELGKISCKNLNTNLAVKKDFSLLLFDYMPENRETKTSGANNNNFVLPYGLRLSNHLPDVFVKNYNLGFTEITNGAKYYTAGEIFKISDFVLNKKIKISSSGQVVLNNHTVSEFDIKILNKIMPDLDINDLFLNQDGSNSTDETANLSFNIFEIFNTIAKNSLQANINANLKIEGNSQNPVFYGSLDIENLTAKVLDEQLPESYLKLLFKGNKTDIDSILFTSPDKNEKTQVIGSYSIGKKGNIDLTFRSNAKFNNIIRLLDSIAQTCGVNDFKNVSATGGIDADFNLNSNLNKVSSTGYLKILPSSVKFKSYNTSIDNIIADVDFMNNNVNIKKAGFSIKNHPLNIHGSISKTGDTNIKITADKLDLKGLLAAFGQTTLLNENDFNNGNISIYAALKGQLTNIKPDLKISFDNFDVMNKLSKASVCLKKALLTFNQNNSKINGNLNVNSLILSTNDASIAIPTAVIKADDKNMQINNTYLLIGNSRIDIKGFINDYLNSKLHINIEAKGDVATSDIAAFIPSEVRLLFPYKGKLPLNVLVSGNQLKQNIELTLNANPDNYLQLADINLLRGNNTKIYSNIVISDNNLEIKNSGVYANSTQVITFGGIISNLSSPKLNINVSVPNNISFPIWGLPASNITGNGKIDIIGTPAKPKLKGKILLTDMSVKDMDFALSNLVANFDAAGISGKADAETLKFGGITASNLSSDFSLKNYEQFYLTDAKADSFGGKVFGNIVYNIPTYAFEADVIGENLNSTDAIYGATGISKALTGTLDFRAKLKASGVTDVEIIKSMNGNIDFNIDDGRFVSIGKLENFVAAQNINSGSVLKSALSALSTLSAIQETDKFKSIKGKMSFAGGSANIEKIEVFGSMMSYYVNGIYNIIRNTANLTILGRLDAKILSYLGPLGQLSADKILSAIPGLGNLTQNYINLMTQDPDKEKIELIPPLSSGSKNYKDFKVVYNGVVGQTSSVKTFKWLSKCETTQVDLKKELINSKDAVKSNIEGQINAAKNSVETTKNNINNIINTHKENVQQQKQAIEQAKNDIQNIKQNAGQSVTNLTNLLKNAASNANKIKPQP